jgi:hypothetical protein
MQIPFEYCAWKFFFQWENREKNLHQELKSHSPSHKTLREALSYFKVARGFPDLEKRVHEIADDLIALSERRDLSSEERVDRLADAFRKKFKRRNVSAASKLLWLRGRTPFIIYDSRAANALKLLGFQLETNDYHGYCVAWRKAFKSNKTAIAAISAYPIEMRCLLPAGQAEYKLLVSYLGKPWFRERVFDIYLWELGGV